MRITKTKQLPKPELSDSIRWWRYRGSFNKALYLRICDIKSTTR
jgi:hypothetical protein